VKWGSSASTGNNTITHFPATWYGAWPSDFLLDWAHAPNCHGAGTAVDRPLAHDKSGLAYGHEVIRLTRDHVGDVADVSLFLVAHVDHDKVQAFAVPMALSEVRERR
jgi:hypothetical protein